MQNEPQNLTKTQLAALDLMIAHMEENPATPAPFITAAVNQLTNATDTLVSVPNVVTDAVAQVGKTTANAPHAITITAPLASHVADNLIGNAATGGNATGTSPGATLSALEQQMTLEHLITLRNKYTQEG